MAAKGVYKWSGIDRVLNSMMTFGGNIVLARLLDPSDFGLVAMVAIFIAIAQNISGCGMSDGLIHKHQPTERDYSTVFVFNAAFGLFFGVSFILLGRPLALFFGREAIQPIMMVIGVCFFFQTLCFTQETRMRKELDMKRMAIVRLSATASATAAGIFMAATGWGYWALVMTHSGLSVFMFIYYLLVSRWIPRFRFYRDSFKEMFGYGVHLMVAYVFNQIGRNINTSVLGKFASPAASGIYSQAQKLEEVPYAITEAVFNWPFLAVLCNEQDMTARKGLCSQMHRRLWLINLVIGLLMLVVSLPAFNLLYGPKWDAAVPVFRLLILFGISSSIKLFYQTVFKAYNRTRLVRNLTFIEVVLQLGLLTIALLCHGSIMTVALTQVLASVIMLVVSAGWYVHIVEIPGSIVTGEFFRTAVEPFIAAGITFALSYLWQGASPFLGCLFTGIAFAAGFLGVCTITRPPYFALMITYIKKRIGSKSKI